LRLQATQSTATRQVQKLAGRMKLADFIELADKGFAQIIKEIESDALFQKLFSPPDRHARVISYQRFPHTSLSSSFYELKEELISQPEGVNIEPLLSRHKEVVSIARKIGLDKFKKYFLYNQSEISAGDIGDECGLTIGEVKKTYGLINDLAIYSDLFYPSTISSEPTVHYSKIARVENNPVRHPSGSPASLTEPGLTEAGSDGPGGLVIAYFSPTIARGRYKIDYQKLQLLKSQAIFSPEELKRLDKLVKKLEIINTRQTILWQILDRAIEYQKFYLKTGDPLELVPFSQRDLSGELGVSPSLISRAISRRSIETPQGEEIPIKNLFPSKKKIASQLVNQIIAQAKKPLSDETIRQELAKRFGVQISRRSVNNYRRELKINEQ